MIDRVEQALGALILKVATEYHHQAYLESRPTRAKFANKAAPGMTCSISVRFPLDGSPGVYEWCDGSLSVPVTDVERMAKLVNDMITPVGANPKPVS